MDRPRGEMPFLDHLEELRWRIIWSVLAIVVGSAIGVFAVIKLDVMNVLTAPLLTAISSLVQDRPELAGVLGDGRLVFLNLTEPFFFAMKLGVVVGLVASSPIVAYHCWAFFAPALDERERRVIVPSMTLGLFLFAVGVAMGYFVALPLMIRFLLLFGSEWFTPALTAGHYLPLVLRLLVVFGLVFELPVVIMILSALGLVTPAFLRSKRRHAIVTMLVGASVLIPGDFVGLTLLLMVPLILLYEASIVLSALVRRERAEPLTLIVPLIFCYHLSGLIGEAIRRGHREAVRGAA
jgi:sec-independent protein translocase protein TatC